MKKFIIIGILILFAAAAFRSFVGLGSSTLEVSVYASQGGQVVTDIHRRLVGIVPDGKEGSPSLGNIQLIQPKAGTTNVYDVPRNRAIGIFVLPASGADIRSIVKVRGGRHRQHEIFMDEVH